MYIYNCTRLGAISTRPVRTVWSDGEVVGNIPSTGDMALVKVLPHPIYIQIGGALGLIIYLSIYLIQQVLRSKLL
jgi:hypothetical protein